MKSLEELKQIRDRVKDQVDIREGSAGKIRVAADDAQLFHKLIVNISCPFDITGCAKANRNLIFSFWHQMELGIEGGKAPPEKSVSLWEWLRAESPAAQSRFFPHWQTNTLCRCTSRTSADQYMTSKHSIPPFPTVPRKPACTCLLPGRAPDAYLQLPLLFPCPCAVF